VVYGHHVSAVMMPTPLIAVALQTSYVKLIDMRIGSASHTLTTHRGAVLAVRWSPRDEHTLATARYCCARANCWHPNLYLQSVDGC
jgi:DNA excision repair protein ERCC-8